MAAATDAENAAAAIAPYVQKRLASLTRSRNACEAELKIVSDVPGFESRVKYLKSRIQDLNNQIFPSHDTVMLLVSMRLACASILRLLLFGFLLTK